MSHKPSRRSSIALRCALLLLGCVAIQACSKPDYHTADGSSGRFEDLRGKWLLVNYWAEWCKPCIEEIPELSRFQKEHAAQVVILTVNYDGAQGEELAKQVQKVGLDLPVLLADPAARLGYPRPAALPTTLVFGPDGRLAHTLQGPQTSASLAGAIGAAATP